ncbi:MAG: YkgJ family cysteine cluster protein [Pseudanabaena sp. ELA645]|jgi:Fe-S-cluster containining protein
MGEAKRRKTEIEKLKSLSPEAQLRLHQLKQDQNIILKGIDPAISGSAQASAMARLLVTKLEAAKDHKTITPVIEFFYSKIEATVSGLNKISDIIDCQKGCSHCCNIWVSISAPEVLFIAKIVREKGQSSIDKVIAANEYTKNYDHDSRYDHPYPCPLLENNVCSIYSSRPKACRLAVSGDSKICERSYLNSTEEDIPTPMLYLSARYAYEIAFAASLKKVALPYAMYEFNAALVRAIETDDAEAKWLSGEDIFADVIRDPTDIFLTQEAQFIYEKAFE